MIVSAGKYATLPGRAGKPSPATVARTMAGKAPTVAAVNVIAKAAKSLTPSDLFGWWQKEARDGGFLYDYLKREKAQTTARYRQVARRMHGFKQNGKSDLRRVADIPLRDYFRWLREDPDFFADNKNLKSLKRDNADVSVYI